MIISFGSKDIEKIWEGQVIKHLPIEIQQMGKRKLRMLHNSQSILDLRIPPSNCLEKLSGKQSYFYSKRINDQWRIIFKWENNQAYKLQIIDYH